MPNRGPSWLSCPYWQTGSYFSQIQIKKNFCGLNITMASKAEQSICSCALYFVVAGSSSFLLPQKGYKVTEEVPTNRTWWGQSDNSMFSELGGIFTLTEKLTVHWFRLSGGQHASTLLPTSFGKNLVKHCANMRPLLSYVTPSTNGKLCLLANQKWKWKVI